MKCPDIGVLKSHLLFFIVTTPLSACSWDFTKLNTCNVAYIVSKLRNSEGQKGTERL